MSKKGPPKKDDEGWEMIPKPLQPSLKILWRKERLGGDDDTARAGKFHRCGQLWMNQQVPAETSCFVQLQAHYPFIVALAVRWMQALTVGPITSLRRVVEVEQEGKFGRKKFISKKIPDDQPRFFFGVRRLMKMNNEGAEEHERRRISEYDKGGDFGGVTQQEAIQCGLAVLLDDVEILYDQEESWGGKYGARYSLIAETARFPWLDTLALLGVVDE